MSRRLPGRAVERLAERHEVDQWSGRLPPPARALRDAIARADAALTLLSDAVTPEVMDAAPGLRAVSNYAVGVDNVDLDAATERGIPVGHTPGVLTDTTADLAVALMLGASRRLVEADAFVRSGKWDTWETDLLLGRDLHGATVGIVGMGRIGSAVARRVEGFGASAIDSRGMPFEEFLERSDFVTIHCPLKPETRGLIGAEALRRMKPTAYLVNTARGPIVDTEALIGALEQGEIAGAALDVTDPEPLPGEHPLLRAPNLLVLPHLGSATVATRGRMADIAVDNLLAALDGERMPHCANPEVYG